VVRLLEARGSGEEARIVGRGALHLLAGESRWSLGSREVLAHSFELSLDAEAYARLEQLRGGRERVKDALADAVATGATMLADLFVVLELPQLPGYVPRRSWAHAYRSAPRKDGDGLADDASLLAGAVSLLAAQGLGSAARLLERGRLHGVEVASSGESPLRRWVVSLSAADLAEVLRSPSVVESVRRAVRLAATRPREVVADVELALIGSEPPQP
jgi:hypothetical protein